MTAYHLADTQDHRVATKPWADFLQAANTDSQCLYMLIDAAQDSRILPELEKSSHTRCCLFNGEQVSSAVKSVSPFLVKIKTLDEFILWCLREGMHQNWMMFLTSAEIHVSDLKLHFKRFSLARTSEGKQCFFRFYDPRVFPGFIAASDTPERADFFRRCHKVWIPQVSTAGTIQFLQLDAEGKAQILKNPFQIFSV